MAFEHIFQVQRSLSFLDFRPRVRSLLACSALKAHAGEAGVTFPPGDGARLLLSLGVPLRVLTFEPGAQLLRLEFCVRECRVGEEMRWCAGLQALAVEAAALAGTASVQLLAEDADCASFAPAELPVFRAPACVLPVELKYHQVEVHPLRDFKVRVGLFEATGTEVRVETQDAEHVSAMSGTVMVQRYIQEIRNGPGLVLVVSIASPSGMSQVLKAGALRNGQAQWFYTGSIVLGNVRYTVDARLGPFVLMYILARTPDAKKA